MVGGVGPQLRIMRAQHPRSGYRILAALMMSSLVSAARAELAVGTTVAARSFVRFGLKPILLTGATLLPVGASALVALGATTSPLVAATGSVVLGLGMSFLSTASIVIIQDSVGWAQRGAARASNIFARNLGSTLGATALGTLLNYHLLHPASGPAIDADQLRRLLDDLASLGSGAVAVRQGLQKALHTTFWAVFAVAALTLLLSLLVPKIALSEEPREAPAE
jgi:MFS family permease